MRATAATAPAMRPGVWRTALALLMELAAMSGLLAITTISFIDTAVVTGASAAAVWWISPS